MKRNLLIFVATFAAGAVGAFVTRAALYDPHADAPVHVPAETTHEPMVRNALKPAAAPSPSASPNAAGHDAHAEHNARGTAATKASATVTDAHAQHGALSHATSAKQPVNTRCAICGMPVDPSVPMMEYQGQTIGFGCRMCAPKFKADPDKYGPLYLRNEVIKR